MNQKSKIEWTDRTWNPVRGCSHISPGCANCYAEKMAARFSRPPGLTNEYTTCEMPSGPFYTFADSEPRPHWTGKVELIEDKLLEPLAWRKPCRVFVNSMSDLFHEALPDEAIDRVFAVMALTPHITYQVLTKRAKRMRGYLASDSRLTRWLVAGREMFGPGVGADVKMIDDGLPGVRLPNVWLGVSAEDQQRADERIPDLLATPAAVRFVSYEPALGPVDWTRITVDLTEVTMHCIEQRIKRGDFVLAESYANYPRQMSLNALTGANPAEEMPGLDWIIIGGESGPGARPFDIDWARQTVQQCKAAAVPVFVKQLGARPYCEEWYDGHIEQADVRAIWGMKDKKGGDMAEWPEDLRVREFPEVRA